VFARDKSVKGTDFRKHEKVPGIGAIQNLFE
jgi:hypothetical protein